MNEYMERQIKSLKEVLKTLRTIQDEVNDVKEKDSDASRVLTYVFNLNSIERRILYYKAMIEVAEYYQEKLGDRDHFNFGKYIGMDIDICCGSFRFGFYLVDDDVEGKLYNRVFGSHSGINEWFRDHFVDLVSVCLGNTNYSHAFGSYDLNDFVYFFERFGKKDKDNLLYSLDEFKKDVESAKKKIDWLDKFSTQNDFLADFDKVLDTYFEMVFKYNTEDD